MAQIRRLRALGAACSLSVFLLLVFVLGVGQAASIPDATRYVAPAGADGANLCVDSAAPCATVQHAVDVATPGDEVRIAAGKYADVHARPAPAVYIGSPVITQVVYLSKTLTLRGGYTTTNWNVSDPDALPTVLDAQGRGRALFMSGEVGAFISPTLEGLWFVNGNAAGLGGAQFGNDGGGGIGALNAALTLNHSRIVSNTAAWGGGIALGRGSRCVLNDNRIISNTAATGGGLFIGQSDATLRGNLFSGNFALQQGGGLLLLYSSATLVNNAIVGNSALGNVSGLGMAGTIAQLYHTTVAGNTGGDGSGVTVNELVSIPSSVFMTNTILVNQTVGITVGVSSQVQMDHVLWFANGVNQGGLGVISVANPYTGDPRLAADGYHLTFPSAAVDNGVEAGVTTDIDGGVRSVGPAPDLGADELPYLSMHLPLVLK